MGGRFWYHFVHWDIYSGERHKVDSVLLLYIYIAVILISKAKVTYFFLLCLSDSNFSFAQMINFKCFTKYSFIKRENESTTKILNREQVCFSLFFCVLEAFNISNRRVDSFKRYTAIKV